MLIPRPTVTYNSIFEKTFTGSQGDLLLLANFANQDDEQILLLQNSTVVANVLNNPTESLTCERKGMTYKVQAIKLGTGGNLYDGLTSYRDPVVNQAFVKSRTVSSGLRCFKVSASDNESGHLDVVYSRDGSSLDDGH